MTAVEPGSGSYEEALTKVARIIQENQEELDDIRAMSEESFRLWLDGVVQRVSEALGITFAKASAFISDILTIAGNARQTFIESYRKAYGESRQIRPRIRE